MVRHWGLTQTVLADVVTIFSMGKRSVLRALLGVKRILDRSDPRFYHCKLFVDDYCVWLQAYRYDTLSLFCFAACLAAVMLFPGRCLHMVKRYKWSLSITDYTHQPSFAPGVCHSNHRLRSLCGKIKEAVELFDKEDVEWPLDELEREAPEMVMDVEPDEEAPQHL
jgi:hypothetical protein